MITNLKDLDNERLGAIVDVQGTISFVDEKQGRKGSFYSCKLEDNSRNSLYFLSNTRLEKGPVTISGAEVGEYNGKTQIKIVKGTRIQGAGSPRGREEGTDTRRSGGAPQTASAGYASLDEMTLAYQECLAAAKVAVNMPLVNDDAILPVATSFFIEGNRIGILQPLAKKLARTDRRGDDPREEDVPWDNGDEVPF